MSTALWDQLWLPLWPLASDDLRTGVYRGSRVRGLQRRWIEANPHALSNLLVVDVDHGDAELRALSGRAKPTAIVSNRANGHAHTVWALSEPVTRTEYASRKATAYAAAVVEGLRRDLDGDKGYSGLMTKNPTHEAWETLWLAPSHEAEDLWTLDRLKEALGDQMPPARWRRGREIVGLGRNCSIFETARHWAYREVRHHFGDSEGLRGAIHAQVHALNAEFSEPLPLSEANGIAASIHRWITTKSRMWQDGPAVYEATFTAIQAARGRLSGKNRTTSGQKFRTALLAQQEQESRMPAENPRPRNGTARELADRFNRSPRTIRRVIAEPREQWESRGQHRQAQALKLRRAGLSYAEIAQEMDVTRNAAAGLVRRALERETSPAGV